MRIYCFDIDGDPDWPSGTAVVARDLRTASSVLVYRDLDQDHVPIDHATKPGSTSSPAGLERRRRAIKILSNSSTTPTAGSNSKQTPRSAVELLTNDRFIGLVAPDVATAAPILEKLRAEGLFRVAQPPPILGAVCGREPPVNTNGLCAVCASPPPTPKAAPRSRVWIGTLFLIAITALVAFLMWPNASSKPAERPVTQFIAPTVQFYANHTRVKKGSRVLLTWNTSGISYLSISPDIGKVPASGKRWVVINENANFTLYGVGKGYDSPASVNIFVIDPGSPNAGAYPKNSGDIPTNVSSKTSAQLPQTSVPAPQYQPPPASKPDPGARSRVSAALDNWAAAYRANDPSRQAALYAPQIDRFFLHQNVENSFVQSYMTTFYARGSHFTSFSFTPPEITFTDADHAQVAFVKSYTLQVASGDIRNVTSRSEIHLVRILGAWKINFERDFKG